MPSFINGFMQFVAKAREFFRILPCKVTRSDHHFRRSLAKICLWSRREAGTAVLVEGMNFDRSFATVWSRASFQTAFSLKVLILKQEIGDFSEVSFASVRVVPFFLLRNFVVD